MPSFEILGVSRRGAWSRSAGTCGKSATLIPMLSRHKRRGLVATEAAISRTLKACGGKLFSLAEVAAGSSQLAVDGDAALPSLVRALALRAMQAGIWQRITQASRFYVKNKHLSERQWKVLAGIVGRCSHAS